jgi:hypothetical protein
MTAQPGPKKAERDRLLYNIAVAWLATRDGDALAEEAPWFGKDANPPEPLCEKLERCPCDSPCLAMSQMFLLPPRDKPKPTDAP